MTITLYQIILCNGVQNSEIECKLLLLVWIVAESKDINLSLSIIKSLLSHRVISLVYLEADVLMTGLIASDQRGRGANMGVENNISGLSKAVKEPFVERDGFLRRMYLVLFIFHIALDHTIPSKVENPRGLVKGSPSKLAIRVSYALGFLFVPYHPTLRIRQERCVVIAPPI